MHNIYANARFDDLDLDTRSQWIGRGKQYLSYGIQSAHDGRLTHDTYAHIRLNDLDLDIDFKNVCKARPTCFLMDYFPYQTIFQWHVYCSRKEIVIYKS